MGGCFVRLLTVCLWCNTIRMDCINGLSLEFTLLSHLDPRKGDLFFLYAREHRIRSLDLHSKSDAAAI